MKITGFLLAAFLLFGVSDSQAEQQTDNLLKGHVYELKSQANEKSPSGKHIDIIFDPSQEGAELNVKKFKFKLGSNWGEVSNDSSFTVSTVFMKPLKNS